MTGFGTYPVLLPYLRGAWGLTNSAAGLIGGMYFGGYMAAVPLLASLTDRVDARRVYLFANALAAAGSLGFALFASGLWPALLCQAVVGAGLAGAYMPGLKALTDRLEGGTQSRAVAFYTATFGIGSSLSLLLAEKAFVAAGWRWAFGIAAAGPALAGLLVIGGLAPRRPHPQPRPAALLDWRPVVRNRAAISYILGYATHCWELFGLRSWIVAFFAFSAGLQPGNRAFPWSAAAIAAAINLLGPPASFLGNELAIMLGRRRVILVIMLASAALGCTVGFSAALPWFAVIAAVALYYSAILGDSAAVTAGLVAAANPAQRGATVALHSFFGFGAGFIAPLVFGVVLDLAGGNARPVAWGLAFASLGLVGGLGPLALSLGRET